MKLSDQALGAVMMALQRSLLEQSDIVPVLKGMDFVSTGTDDELTVANPPVVDMSAASEDYTTGFTNGPIESTTTDTTNITDLTE